MKKILWKTKDDEIVSCEEKVKVLNENYDEIIDLMSFDKKNHLDKLKFVLLKDLGIVEIDVEVSENLIKESFDFYLS